ncbi:MAG TPA: ribbon-helix-helix domain-containing protein [Micromonosporaceae bacterium]|nr:ribbon-helix-helix domain-containing protein [Micromonosporaceae bacterium]
MTVSISITLDDELSADLNAAVDGGNRSALVAEAIREYLDRRAVAAATAWHASLTGEDAAAFADFNAAW